MNLNKQHIALLLSAILSCPLLASSPAHPVVPPCRRARTCMVDGGGNLCAPRGCAAASCPASPCNPQARAPPDPRSSVAPPAPASPIIVEMSWDQKLNLRQKLLVHEGPKKVSDKKLESDSWQNHLALNASKEQLMKACDDEGLETGGNSAELTQRLVDWMLS